MPKSNLKPNLLVIFFIFLFLIIPFFVGAATLYLLPQSQTVYQGDTFLVEVRLDTEGEEINAVGTDLKFPADLLEIIDLSKGGSVLTLWVEEPSIKQGEVPFVGGVPGGFKGEGLIGKITFLGKEIGRAEVSFKEDSKALYGEGIPADLSFLEGNYEIIKRPEGLPVISSRTHPDQSKWHKSDTLHLHWDLADGAQYSFILSYDPLAEPDDVPDKPKGELIWVGDMEYPNLEDGIYYFSLKQKLPAEDWSEKVGFRAMIDVTSPEEFRAEIGQDPLMFEGKYFLSSATIDKTSGIDYYEVKEGKRNFKRAKSPYLLGDQSLRSKILVKAVDKAGNERVSEITPPKKPLPYWIITSIIFLVIVGWIIYRVISSRLKAQKSKPQFKT
ncbi:hypothetical protein KJA16_02635 [Patescibacteria group bacterium]|nr:hypothetical protein [Patescibacteria group bacterium]